MKGKAQKRAIAELTFAGALWGFGFICTIWALRSMGPLSITGWRFALAALTGLLISSMITRHRKQMSWQQFFLAAIPGLLLCGTLVLQTWGLRFTTATKSGFLTTLYVLMVPMIERVWLKRRLPKMHFVYVTLALIGVALICDLTSELGLLVSGQASDLAPKQRWNIGDLLTLLCAIAASVHIVWFGLIQKKIGSAFVFNNYQSIWAGALPLLLSFFLEPMPTPNFADFSMYGLISLTFGSTMIAFALQVHSQKVINPSLASLIFLLESPFATLFAVTLLGETLKTSQWFGAGLILVAAGLSAALVDEEEAAA